MIENNWAYVAILDFVRDNTSGIQYKSLQERRFANLRDKKEYLDSYYDLARKVWYKGTLSATQSSSKTSS